MNFKVCFQHNYCIFLHKMRFFSTSKINLMKPLPNKSETKKFPNTSFMDKEKQKSLRIAILGCPNVGKSLLTNRLINANVCAVSRLVDTTRENTTTSLTHNNCQLEIIDTPGLIGFGHAKRLIGKNLDTKILADPERAITKAEHILVVADVMAIGKYLHHRILYLLHRYAHIPASLVLNKIDLLNDSTDSLELAEILTEGIVNGQPICKKLASFGKMGSHLLGRNNAELSIQNRNNVNELKQGALKDSLQKPINKCDSSETRKLFLKQNGWSHFKDVYFVSSVKGDGIEALRENLLKISECNERKWSFEKDVVCTKDPRKASIELIRSELMNRLPSDVAYSLWPQTAHWEVEGSDQEKMLNIVVNIHCDKKRWARLVTQIAEDMEKNITKQFKLLFRSNIRFKMHVKYAGKMFMKEDHINM